MTAANKAGAASTSGEAPNTNAPPSMVALPLKRTLSARHSFIGQGRSSGASGSKCGACGARCEELMAGEESTTGVGAASIELFDGRHPKNGLARTAFVID